MGYWVISVIWIELHSYHIGIERRAIEYRDISFKNIAILRVLTAKQELGGSG
jgi:hypothetical protein